MQNEESDMSGEPKQAELKQHADAALINRAEIIYKLQRNRYKMGIRFCTYALLANGVATLSCFTSLGTGWNIPGLVSTIASVIWFFLLGLFFSSVAFATLESANTNLATLQITTNGKPWSSSDKKLLAQFEGESKVHNISLAIGISLFFLGVADTGIEAISNNSSNSSHLIFSPAHIDQNKLLSFSVANIGNRGAFLESAILTVEPNSKLTGQGIIPYQLVIPSNLTYVGANLEADISIPLYNSFLKKKKKDDFIKTMVNWSASDALSNSATCSLELQYRNFIPPTISIFRASEYGYQTFVLPCVVLKLSAMEYKAFAKESEILSQTKALSSKLNALGNSDASQKH